MPVSNDLQNRLAQRRQDFAAAVRRCDGSAAMIRAEIVIVEEYLAAGDEAGALAFLCGKQVQEGRAA